MKHVEFGVLGTKVAIDLDQCIQVAVLPELCEVGVLLSGQCTLQVVWQGRTDDNHRTRFELEASMHLTFDRVGQLKQSVLELLPTDLLIGRQLIVGDEVGITLQRPGRAEKVGITSEPGVWRSFRARWPTPMSSGSLPQPCRLRSTRSQASPGLAPFPPIREGDGARPPASWPGCVRASLPSTFLTRDRQPPIRVT